MLPLLLIFLQIVPPFCEPFWTPLCDWTVHTAVYLPMILN